MLSVLLRPGPEAAPLVPIVMGLAAVDGVGAALDGSLGSPGATSVAPRVGLKWPNDLLVPDLDDRKLAGILAEATSAGAGSPATGGAGRRAAQPGLVVVVGMGLNLRWSVGPPEEIADRAVTLEELAGRSVDRWRVIRAVLARLDRWLTRLEESGPGPILEAYRRRCVTIGRDITLETPSGLIEGTATGVAGSGALQVATGTGTVEVMAGDAHHR